ncbi:hypothetical protein EWM64_g2729 [Hericium alpestre]|uniref:Uncharacterized protein n=1 Tax=Hericium alpestre TaxID=135208 RepID=A0A4Z0A4N1_9AGAM|nr:hypothetical protein EWM64_g2729 [Hericium alpestre]
MTAPFTEVLNTLPLASVQTAQYELPLGETRDPSQTLGVMRCTPEVESLWVTGPGSAVVAKALQHQQTVSQIAPPAPTLVLPSLRILGFTKVNLSAKRDTQLEPDHRRLRARLQARKDMDGRTLKLYIQKCTITPEWLEGFGEVADVEWDGKNMSFPDD